MSHPAVDVVLHTMIALSVGGGAEKAEELLVRRFREDMTLEECKALAVGG
jgi:20S proteasome alpha/beta subunit